MRQFFLLFVLFIAVLRVMKMLRRAQSQAARPDVRPGTAPSRWPGGAQANPSRDAAAGAGANSRARTGTANTGALAEPMVCCARCGVYVPKSEAIVVAGASFCCNEHAR